MVRCVFIILASLIAILSCAPLETDIPVNVIQTATVTSSAISANTRTPLPTETPTASASITPLPTIPTFAPTFDASTIVTVTPAPMAECPKENSAAVAEFATPDSYGSCEIYSAEEILDYLNSGGALTQLATGLWGEVIDLTGDGLSEVVYRGLVRYNILSCKDRKYQNLFELATYDFSMDLEDILDLNKDGIPELIFYSFSRHDYASVYIVGWDGSRFRSLIDMGTDTSTGKVIDAVFATAYHKLIETNGDRLKEMVVVYNVKELCGGLGGLNFCNGTPTREQITTLGWNGQNYVALKQETHSPPQYRFQAIQDGDQQARDGNYSEALSFYQAAIFDDQLEWWSPERRKYEVHLYMSQYDANPTVYPTPNPDITEYPRLAAYAYYRIMLLHIVQQHASDASTVYKTLQQKFTNDPNSRPYVEMAIAFWETYQSTHNMYDGCAVAIQYAEEHPEILVPLGSDYHGDESHTYVPADVCPFR